MTRLYRTYSSPSLNRQRLDQQDDYDFFVVGDRVYLDRFRAASVAYFGEVEFAAGDWVGLVLDMPTGNHDGKVHGRRYFQCEPLRGLFARPSRLTRMEEPSSAGRQATPLPSSYRNPLEALSTQDYSRSSSASYMYDDDYRSSPTVSSLQQKLRSLDQDIRNGSPGQRRQQQGILKRPGSRSPWRSRAEELSERFEAVSAGSLRNRSPSVFEFRPKRSQLGEYDNQNKSSIDLSTGPLKVGDRVAIKTDRGGEETGTLKFVGETNFATGEWAGLELDARNGKNDGSVLGYRYFTCPQNYGLFVPVSRVKKLKRKFHEFDAVRSTLKSPPPLRYTSYDRPSSSTSSAYSSSSPLSNSYGARSSSHIYDNYVPTYSRTLLTRPIYYDQRSLRSESPKFDDKDIDYQLTKFLSKTSLNDSGSRGRPVKTFERFSSNKPKAVEFTFTSSKYDGNPIANRTILYN